MTELSQLGWPMDWAKAAELDKRHFYLEKEMP